MLDQTFRPIETCLAGGTPHVLSTFVVLPWRRGGHRSRRRSHYIPGTPHEARGLLRRKYMKIWDYLAQIRARSRPYKHWV